MRKLKETVSLAVSDYADEGVHYNAQYKLARHIKEGALDQGYNTTAEVTVHFNSEHDLATLAKLLDDAIADFSAQKGPPRSLSRRSRAEELETLLGVVLKSPPLLSTLLKWTDTEVIEAENWAKAACAVAHERELPLPPHLVAYQFRERVRGACRYPPSPRVINSWSVEKVLEVERWLDNQGDPPPIFLKAYVAG